MSTPIVSILIPFKNTANYLEDCLESILKQTFTSWEVLIVDDRSTDDSRIIVQRYTDLDSRIHLLNNQGNGIIDALRTAYSHVKGTLITRMDSDDIMMENKLMKLQKSLQKYGRGYLATGKIRYFSKTGIGDGYKRYQDWLNTLTNNGANFDEIYKECVIPSPCWMVYKKDFEICGGFESNTYPEDYDLAFRFFKHGLKCIPNNEVLHLWRDYPSRTSRVDVKYAENSFIEIKVKYFLELSYNSNRKLVIWGAGSKGKKIAKLLIERNLSFDWVCNNPNKIGKQIYNQTLKSFEDLMLLKNPQCIISVANRNDQTDIKKKLDSLNMSFMSHYYFFC